ncbi:MAG TPA: hypothetical protein V6C58_06945 [Allocoleopsis sp.]
MYNCLFGHKIICLCKLNNSRLCIINLKIALFIKYELGAIALFIKYELGGDRAGLTSIK